MINIEAGKMVLSIDPSISREEALFSMSALSAEILNQIDMMCKSDGALDKDKKDRLSLLVNTYAELIKIDLEIEDE
ncbi:MAG: hypothetical protein ACI3VR_14860 [Intestinibacter sp.]|uniref:hypothetical protein n=1 Tax=Intestinibacter sp. TaxID=1965304 RepID=UPI003F16F890